MSAFAIFVLVLTIVYVVYYAVTITHDLWGKKGESTSRKEVFDINTMMEEESAISVNESETGFRIADKAYEMLNSDGDEKRDENGNKDRSWDRDWNEKGKGNRDGDRKTGLAEKGEYEKTSVKNMVKEMEERLQEKMEETQPFMLEPMWADELTKSLLEGKKPGRPEIRMELVNDKV